MQKSTLIDWPDKVACVLFTSGCNMRCPYCYNKDVVLGHANIIDNKEIVQFLKDRKGLLEGVVLSGGEPTLQKDLLEFIQELKDLGYKIKLDTNGTNPQMIQHLLKKNLLDYIAMDIKAPKEKYEQNTQININVNDIEQSIKLVKQAPDYEFRTTVVPTLLDKQDIIKIAKWLSPAKKFYLQQFTCSPPLLDPELKVKPYKTSELEAMCNEIKDNFDICTVRS